MKLISKQRVSHGWRERAVLMLIGAAAVLRGLVEVLSFGYLTSGVSEKVIFSDTLKDWYEQ